MHMPRTLAAMSAVAMIAAPASAAFVGLSVEDVTGHFQTGSTHFGANQANVTQAWNAFTSNGANPRTVWRIYADFDNPNDFLVNVQIVVGGQPLTINTGGTVYNTIGNSVTAPDASLLNDPATAAAAFDSYATIGVELNTGNDQTQWGGIQHNIHQMFDTGLTGPQTYQSDIDAWSVNVGAPQSQVVAGGPAGYRVLLAQVTVQDGAWIDGYLSGQWGMGTFALGDPELFDFGASFTSIPAPHAGALLMIAAFGMRRRRRS